MPVYAECDDCTSLHRLGEREAVPGTTECPDCPSTTYQTIPNPSGVDEKEEQYLKEKLVSVDGVGPTVAESIVQRYGVAEEVKATGPNGLCNIDHVGPTVAKRIVSEI